MLKIKKIIYCFYLLIALVLFLLSYVIFIEAGRNNLTVYFFDVGQGDSILIQTPYRQKILIDGGPDNSVIYKLGRYLPFYDREIDLVILTHPDADHLIGLVEVLKRYKINNVLLTGIQNNTPAYQYFADLVKEKNIKKIFARQPISFYLGNNLLLEIIYPINDLAIHPPKTLNDSSIVAKLESGEKSILFTGDAPLSVENFLLKSRIDVGADVLKISHHGSKGSSGINFLKAVAARLAIISVGQNTFGHPAPEVLERFLNLKISVLSTEQSGDIIIQFSNGYFQPLNN